MTFHHRAVTGLASRVRRLRLRRLVSSCFRAVRSPHLDRPAVIADDTLDSISYVHRQRFCAIVHPLFGPHYHSTSLPGSLLPDPACPLPSQPDCSTRWLPRWQLPARCLRCRTERILTQRNYPIACCVFAKGLLLTALYRWKYLEHGISRVMNDLEQGIDMQLYMGVYT